MSIITSNKDLQEIKEKIEKDDDKPNVKVDWITSNDNNDYDDVILPEQIETLQYVGIKKDLLDKWGYGVYKITNKSNKILLNPKIILINPENDKNIPTEYVLRRGKHATFHNKFTKVEDFENFKFPYEAVNMKPAKRFESDVYGLNTIQMIQISEQDKEKYYKEELGTTETIYLGKYLRPNIPIWIAFKGYGTEKFNVTGDVPHARKYNNNKENNTNKTRRRRKQKK